MALGTDAIQNDASTIREAPLGRSAVHAAPRRMTTVAPTFFRGLFVAIPLTIALWIAIILAVRVEF